MNGKLKRFITRMFSKEISIFFHILAYHQPFHRSWLGKEIQKNPYDLLKYQEIIWKNKPDTIIETGTAKGGSALFFASILDLIGKGKVITIDINKSDIKHSRIEKIIGSSTSGKVLLKVRKLCKGKTMVILDSDHSFNHVNEELINYSDFVSIGQYLVVEDTNINGNPVLDEFGNGPMEAIMQFLKYDDRFIADKDEILTFFPNAWLRRIL
jgi:cephalosporin hydroxylase